MEEPLLSSRLRAFVLLLAAGLLHACATPSAPTPSPAPATATAPARAPLAPEPPLAPAPPPTALPLPIKDAFTAGAPAVPLPRLPFGVLEARSPITTVDATRPRDDLWQRIRKGFAMPDLQGALVRRHEAYYKAHPDYLQRSFDRGRVYLYHIVSELERRGMPTELALLPMVESAFNPMAYSRAHASGLWQFIPGTGRRFELEQSWWYDERRDIVDSTNAALDYLQFLYELHHDWHLALASYNWGEGAVSRAIARNRRAHRPATYSALRMPRETRSYVPKLQALKNIVRDPARFGIDLDPIPNEPYFVQVSETPEMDLVLAARLAEMPVEEFLALNPGFNRPLIRASESARLVLPSSKVDVFYANLARQKGAGLVSWQVYRPKKGEKFGTIAKKFKLSIAELKKVNGIPGASWRVPKVLVVPTRSEALVATKLPVMYAPPIPVRGRVGIVHRVRPGDTLSRIAARYHVSVKALKQWNRTGDHLRVGQKIYIRKNLT